MNKSGRNLEKFEIKMAKDAIHLVNKRSDYTLNYVCTWLIRNFSTVKKDCAEGFREMEQFPVYIHLLVDHQKVKITIQCLPSRCNRTELISTGCLKFDVTVSTTSGIVLFKYERSNAKGTSSTSPFEFYFFVAGEDFQKLKRLPNDTLVITCRSKCRHIENLTTLSLQFMLSGYFFWYTSVEENVNAKSLQVDQENCSDSSAKEKVILCVGDETEMVNKGVLCERSAVFDLMFRNDMKENTVTITDIKMPVLRALVSFLSSGVVPDCDANFLCELYYAAHKYGIAELQQVCVKLLLSEISLENIFQVLKLSVLHDDELLKSSVMAIIGMNIETINLTNDWENLMRDEPEIASRASTFFDF